MASTEGGMDIEEVAEETPELLHKINVDPNVGLMGYQIRDLGLALGLSGASQILCKDASVAVRIVCSGRLCHG